MQTFCFLVPATIVLTCLHQAFHFKCRDFPYLFPTDTPSIIGINVVVHSSAPATGPHLWVVAAKVPAAAAGQAHLEGVVLRRITSKIQYCKFSKHVSVVQIPLPVELYSVCNFRGNTYQ